MNSFPFDGKPLYAGHLGLIDHIRFSPNGEFFATSCANDGTVRIWRTQTGELLRIFFISADDGLAFSSDGEHLITVNSRGVNWWNVQTGENIKTRILRGIIWASISAHGKWIAIRQLKGDIPFIQIRELETFRLRHTLQTAFPQVWDGFNILGFSANEELFLCGDGSGTLTVNLSTGERSFRNEPAPDSIFERSCFCSWKGRETIVKQKDDSLQFVDILEENVVDSIPWQKHIWNGVNAWTNFHHSPFAAILGYYKGVTIVNLESGEHVAQFPRWTPWYRSMAISADDQFLILGSDDGRIEVYQTSDWKRIYMVPGGSTEMVSMAVDPSNRYLITLQKKGKSFLWDLVDCCLVGEWANSGFESTFTRSGQGVDQDCFTSFRTNDTPSDYSYKDFENPTFPLLDGRCAVYFPSLGCLRLLSEPDTIPADIDQARKALIRFQRGRKERLWDTLALSPNGEWVAFLDSKSIALVQTKTGKGRQIRVGRVHTSGVASVSNDGKIAAAVDLGLATVFDVQNSKEIVSIQANDTSGPVALSSDGVILAAGDVYENLLVVRNSRSKKRARTLDGHAAGIRSLVFTPDGKTLVSCAGDGQIILWDTETWERKATMMVFAKIQPPPVWIAFTPDDQWNGSQVIADCFVEGSEELRE